jgi:hypothetical protein
MVELAAAGSLMFIDEGVTEAAVEGFILGEPERWPGLAPEGDDIGWTGRTALACVVGCGRACMKRLFDKTLAGQRAIGRGVLHVGLLACKKIAAALSGVARKLAVGIK